MQSPVAMRFSLVMVVAGGVLGLAYGVARGFSVVAANDYWKQLPDLARWVLVDNATAGLLRGALGALAVLLAVLLLWPLMRILLGSWRRAFTGALFGVPLIALYLVCVWYVNRAILPGAFTAASLIGNLALLLLTLASWYALVRLSDRRPPGPDLARHFTWMRPLPLLALVLAVFAVQSTRVVAKPDARAEDPNVLLIVVDALRPDRLGAYGYERNTSPTLDALAKEGWLFLNAATTAPWTKPSIASLFTGLHPRSHGISAASWNLGDEHGAAVAALPQRLLTLTEILANAGYRTSAFGKNHHLVARLGFAQGFEEHDLAVECNALQSAARRLGLGIAERLTLFEDESCRTGRRINEKFLQWLPDDDEPFFAWLHHIDVHWPYRAPAPHAGAFGERRTAIDFNTQQFYATFGPERAQTGAPPPIEPDVLQDLSDAYDEAIRYVDAEIGALIAELQRRGLYDRTLIVVTADHGEQFLEHGEIGHGSSLHEVLLRVPLIVKFPCPGEQCAPRTVREPVQLIDVAPTVLEAVGVAPPPGLAGRNLAAPHQDRVLFAERGEQIALRTNDFKYIYDLETSEAALYSLRDDPAERINLLGDDPELALAMRDRMFQWLEETDQTGAAPREEVAADGAMLDRLKALGYVK